MIDQLENPPKCKTQLRERLKKKKKKRTGKSHFAR